MNLNINNLQKQFALLSPRERVLSIAVSVVVLFYSVYLLIFAPILADKIVLEQKIKAQQQTYQYLSSISAEVAELRNQQPETDTSQEEQSLMVMIDTSSVEMDIKSSIKRMVPDDAYKVTLWLEDCAFDQFIDWMAALETNLGITVSQLAVTVDQENIDKVSIKVILSKQPR